MNILQSAFAFTGCFLGAGFVSGQEIYKFFASFEYGEIGLAFSMLLIFIFANMIAKLSFQSGSTSIKDVLVTGSKPFGKIISAVQIVFLFGLVTIMLAGAGNVIESLFGIPRWVGCIMMSAIVYLIAITGIDGVVKVFSVCVPLITAVGIALCIYVLTIGGADVPLPENVPSAKGANIFLPNLILSCIVYAGYNMLASIGTLVECKSQTEHKISRAGLMIGTVSLLVMSLCIFKALDISENATYYELPMLEIAKSVSLIAGLIYGILLLGALLGTSVSSTVAISTSLCAEFPKLKQYRYLFLLVLVGAALMISFCGFGNLIGTVYTAFGYVFSAFLFARLFTLNKNLDTRKDK